MTFLRIFAAIAFGLLLIGCSGPSSSERAEAQVNRAKILSLVSVGDSLEQAETKLKNAGFRFTYPTPIDPTGRGEYLQQLVLIHPALLKPGAQNSLRYTIGIDASKSETAPYLVVDADTAGIITKLK